MGANEVDNGGFAVVGTEIAPSMAANIWQAGAKPSKTVVKLNGDTASLRKPRSRLEARIPVCGIPRELLDTTTTEWTLISRGRWSFADPIELGEGRATIQLLELLAVCPGSFRHKLFSSEDNSSWGGAATKGRLPSPALNYLCRRKAALCLAKRWTLMLPWVQSSDQPADHGSRILP